MSDLVQAIEQLYDAFAAMPRPRNISDEYGDLEEGEKQHLCTFPLRVLSSGVLVSYLLDAIYTVGTWDDFRYFLPRILELLTQRELESDRVIWRLRYAEKNGLPFTEQQKVAIHKFGVAYWREQISVGVLYWDLEEWQAFGLARNELLNEWLKHAQGAIWIANSVVMGWALPPEWNVVDIRARLESAFHAETDPNDAALISDAILILEAR